MKKKISVIATILFVMSFLIALYACNEESKFLTNGNMDSIVYGHTAVSLASGTGFVPYVKENMIVSTSHFPPLYPLILAGCIKTGLSLGSSERLVSTIGFSLTITLLFVQCLLLTKDKNIASAVTCSFFAAISVAVYAIFFHAMSETIFIPLLMLSILTLCRFIEEADIKMAVISCLAASLLPVTRYLGVAAVASNCLALCLSLGKRKNRSVYKRILDAIKYGIFACIPSLLWFGYMISTNTIRKDHYQPDFFARLLEPISCIWYHFIPFRGSFYIQAIFSFGFVVAFAYLCYFTFRRRNQNISFHLNADLSVWILFLIVYGSFLLIMTYLTGEPWPFAERILFPYQIVFFLILSIMIRKMFQAQSSFIKYGFFAILFIYTPLAVFRAFSVIHKYHLELR